MAFIFISWPYLHSYNSTVLLKNIMKNKDIPDTLNKLPNSSSPRALLTKLHREHKYKFSNNSVQL